MALEVEEDVEALKVRIAQLEAEKADMKRVLDTTGESYWHRVAEGYQAKNTALLDAIEKARTYLIYVGVAAGVLDGAITDAKRKEG